MHQYQRICTEQQMKNCITNLFRSTLKDESIHLCAKFDGKLVSYASQVQFSFFKQEEMNVIILLIMYILLTLYKDKPISHNAEKLIYCLKRESLFLKTFKRIF